MTHLTSPTEPLSLDKNPDAPKTQIFTNTARTPFGILLQRGPELGQSLGKLMLEVHGRVSSLFGPVQVTKLQGMRRLMLLLPHSIVHAVANPSCS